jgi:kinetochore protein Nuf2
MEKPQEFSFPKLKKHEILPCLRQLGIDFNGDDLTTPAGGMEKYLRMLELLTEFSTGISREEMAQPAFTGLKVLAFPEMHDDSIPFLNTFRACSKMMEICGIDDFSLKDFMTPCPKRLQRQLAAIINFIRYKEEKEGMIHELNATTTQYNEKLQRTKEKYDASNHRYTLLKEQTVDETKRTIKLEAECKEIEADISRMHAQQADIKDESTELKSRNNDLKEAIADKSLQYDECLNTRKKLSAQIVNSPER